MDGEPSLVSKMFFDESVVAPAESNSKENGFKPDIDTKEIEIRNIEILPPTGNNGIRSVPLFSDFQIRLNVYCAEPMKNIEIHVGLHNAELIYVHKTSSLMLDTPLDLAQGENLINVTIPKIPISPGPYGIGLGVFDWARRPIWTGSNLLPISIELPIEYEKKIPKSTLTYLPTQWSFD